MGHLTCDELAGPLSLWELELVERALSSICAVSVPALFMLASLRGALRYSKLEELCLVREQEKIRSVLGIIYAPYGVFVEICVRKTRLLSVSLVRKVLEIAKSLARNYSADFICVDDIRIADKLLLSLRVRRHGILMPFVLDLEEASPALPHSEENYSLGSGYSIRTLTEEHIEQVRELMSLWSPHHVKLVEYTLKYGMPIGAFYGERLVGYLSTYVMLPECWLLASLFVHPEHRRRGLGKALLSAMTSMATGTTKRLVATVEPTNVEAKRLYLKFGFRPIYRTQHTLELSAE